MNFLAHLYLSPPDDDIIFGNFIADSVRGRMFFTFSPRVQQGILFHRFIDAFTDSHPVFLTSKARLSTDFGKFSGVIADIYYDHFLAAHWPEFSTEALPDFAQKHYRLIDERHDLLPHKSKRIFPYMKSQDWLTNYADLHFLQRVFEGMSRRTSFESRMEHAVVHLQEHYTGFETDFMGFFPQMITGASTFLTDDFYTLP